MSFLHHINCQNYVFMEGGRVFLSFQKLIAVEEVNTKEIFIHLNKKRVEENTGWNASFPFIHLGKQSREL